MPAGVRQGDADALASPGRAPRARTVQPQAQRPAPGRAPRRAVGARAAGHGQRRRPCRRRRRRSGPRRRSAPRRSGRCRASTAATSADALAAGRAARAPRPACRAGRAARRPGRGARRGSRPRPGPPARRRPPAAVELAGLAAGQLPAQDLDLVAQAPSARRGACSMPSTRSSGGTPSRSAARRQPGLLARAAARWARCR